MFYGQCWKCGERWNLGTESTCTCEPEQPQRAWVDVPDEEIKLLWIQYRAALPRYLCFAKALLAKAKEENT